MPVADRDETSTLSKRCIFDSDRTKKQSINQIKPNSTFSIASKNKN